MRHASTFLRMILKTDFLEKTSQRHACAAFQQAARHCFQGQERFVGTRLFCGQSEYVPRFHGEVCSSTA